MPRQRSESSRSNGSMRRQNNRSSHVFAPKPATRGSSKDLPAVQKESSPAPAPSAAHAAEAKGSSTKERFKDMATTAAGVAAGSAVGHAVGAGLTGMFQGKAKEQPQQEGAAAAPAASSSSHHNPQLVEDGPCAFELRQFLKCTEENGSDLSICKEFNEAMQQCRRRYNV
ncbi:coiled-coil-helix-coiled-coil-helix domain-containing protein 10, mitochondrial [Drosophila takahashii]|uniref:coiled-coil-helix-coiled-coil-helix domain-containing protein 10, mitochondrial n=1 Tax=Drosophila takahashii TaxID=29030 RepID=UPI001CF864D8|nr:coiled-coil-helix-coiled-coil-helix domain-containing protein 10, mitochondrial [Drosophila takahashii]